MNATSTATTPRSPATTARRPHLDASTRRAQILEATVVLIDRLGPEAVTIRQIAAVADLNHAVIYRHFGDRASLISEAILSEMEGWAQVVAAAPDPTAAVIAGFEHLGQRTQVAGALARAIGGQDQTSQPRYPVIDALIQQLTEFGVSEAEAAEVATAAVALMTGWVAAEPFWIAAGRTSGADARVRARAGLERQLVTLVQAVALDGPTQRASDRARLA